MDNKARKKAEKIDPADRLSEIEKNLLEATENLTTSSKELNQHIDIANSAIVEKVNNSGLEMMEQQKLMSTVQQINELLKRARKGKNVIEELKKLNL